MKQAFRARINGKQFRVGFHHLEDKTNIAEVDCSRKTIGIDPSANSYPIRAQVEILLHEALHVLLPDLSERRVLKAGADLARLLVTARLIYAERKS